METQSPPEHAGRVLVLALAFFGGLAILGLAHGVFERQSSGTLAALAIFTAAFAGLTWKVDGAVRNAVKASLRRLLPRRREPRQTVVPAK